MSVIEGIIRQNTGNPMPQQQPFKSQGPFMTEEFYTNGDKKLSEFCAVKTLPEYKTWDRFEQLDFLKDTTTVEFQANLLDEIVRSMTDREFLDTYEYITRCHDLARDYDELNERTQD